MGKHEARYFACPRCGFVSVEDPYWLAEAYSSPIADVDLGSVWRAYRYSRSVKALINLCGFDRGGKFLDYGGGFGIFVRQMRDLGYDFRYYDSYCENLFARGFDADIEGTERFEMLTTFEVFEHLQDPLGTLERLASLTSTIVFSTAVIPSPAPKIGDWWYYLPVTGQHVSFYSHRSLEIIAERFNMRSYSHGKEIHMLSSKAIPEPLFRLVSSPRLAKWLDLFMPGQTLLYRDFDSGIDRAGTAG
ncbi:MAG TPA: class I SAM-dependent methyltransferase [Bacteroidota bacterium]|nr:class I SAM-dependent methyltransferase [Bacteroidota bacterium]